MPRLDFLILMPCAVGNLFLKLKTISLLLKGIQAWDGKAVNLFSRLMFL